MAGDNVEDKPVSNGFSIDWSKPLRTKSGAEAVLLETVDDVKYPRLVATKLYEGSGPQTWSVLQYSEAGELVAGQPDGAVDLVNVDGDGDGVMFLPCNACYAPVVSGGTVLCKKCAAPFVGREEESSVLCPKRPVPFFGYSRVEGH